MGISGISQKHPTSSAQRQGLRARDPRYTVSSRHQTPKRSSVQRATQAGSRWLHRPDGSIVDYRESTVGGIYRLWLDGRVDEIDALLAWLAAFRINAIRPWLNLDSEFWHHHKRANSVAEGDRWFDELGPFVRHCAARGMYSRVCLFAGVEPFGARPEWVRRPDVVSGDRDVVARMHAYVERVASLLADEPAVLLEVANEPSQIGFGSDSRVVLELGEHCHGLAPGRLLNFGAANDEDSTYYARRPADWFDEHLQRADEWDGFAALKRIIHCPATDTTWPTISGEWMNLGGGGHLSTATAFAAAAMLRLKKCSPAFHARALLWATVPDEATAASLAAWSRGCDLIPQTFPGSACNGHWPCSPIDSSAFPASEDESDEHRGPVRVYGLNGPDGFLGVSLREPGGYELPLDRPIETLHREQWGAYQARIFRAERG